MFAVQVIKDASMANRVNTVLKKANEKDKLLIVCSAGHVAYGFGIPERIWKLHPKLKEQSIILLTREAGAEELDKPIEYSLPAYFNREPEGPHDFCFSYCQEYYNSPDLPEKDSKQDFSGDWVPIKDNFQTCKEQFEQEHLPAE
jgi:hypothetical protein